MGGPLSVTFREIYMIKMESEIVIPQKLLFYHRYVDEIYSRRKKFKHDELFETLNNYYPKIKLTIEVSPAKVLDTNLHLNSGISLRFIGKQQNNLHTGQRKFLKDTNVI